ncbi:hypothetical protein CEUSTIGMA_g11742.t1 [Chlamydomonas eustigma]|uniref:Chromo domain-containing protein n=1 Tax=Chlamydomonas eustigma TaxID=1157962 RepID=A0A250XND5_9CHLO|nr:hypothetical protein CEUSTIGMA_g11742.t1 [Chlamydomonas eustigma]|eukprot:GAX84320.1 hypothetical protein CEUSTIGMA_g11742.t1 [Chlamydomonas eustigma]
MRYCRTANRYTERRPRKRQRTSVTDQVYAIESIVDHQGGKKTLRFLIKWQGYSSAENSWVPAASMKKDMTLASFKELVTEYESRTGKEVHALSKNPSAALKPAVQRSVHSTGKAAKGKKTLAELYVQGLQKVTGAASQGTNAEEPEAPPTGIASEAGPSSAAPEADANIVAPPASAATTVTETGAEDVGPSQHMYGEGLLRSPKKAAANVSDRTSIPHKEIKPKSADRLASNHEERSAKVSGEQALGKKQVAGMREEVSGDFKKGERKGKAQSAGPSTHEPGNTRREQVASNKRKGKAQSAGPSTHEPGNTRREQVAAEEELFVVQSFVDHKGSGKGLLFMVRWAGYTAEDDTWQQATLLKKDVGARNYKILLDDYKKRTGDITL